MRFDPTVNAAIDYKFNVAHVTELRDHMVKLRDGHFGKKLGFYMGSYFEKDITRKNSWVPDYAGNRCGAVACLAGHAVLLSNCVIDDDDEDVFPYFPVAMRWLGLDSAQACYLFYGDWRSEEMDSCTPDQAIAQLNHMLATGDVWRDEI